MDSGFIYVMSNDSMPGLLKIGTTKHHPSQRAAELYQTGVPDPFVIEFAILSSNARDLEKRVHAALNYCRFNQSREFFRIDISDAILCVVNLFVSSFDHQIIHCDSAINEDYIEAVVTRCGLLTADFAQLAHLVSNESWEDASTRLKSRRLGRCLPKASENEIDAEIDRRMAKTQNEKVTSS